MNDPRTPRLSETAETRLAAWCQEIGTDPTRIRVRFPAAAREIARTPGTSPDPGAARVEDDVRVRLLAALDTAYADDPDGRDRLSAEVHDLYRFGDADERRAVLHGLAHLGGLGLADRAVDLVADALRSNDPRLVAAAMGRYAADRLDAAGWRQGVLKCLFVGVPLGLVAGLEERTDDDLLRMVADFAAERRAAGRSVPEDAAVLLSSDPRSVSSTPRES